MEKEACGFSKMNIGSLECLTICGETNVLFFSTVIYSFLLALKLSLQSFKLSYIFWNREGTVEMITESDMKQSFLFYISWQVLLQKIPKEVQLTVVSTSFSLCSCIESRMKEYRVVYMSQLYEFRVLYIKNI